MNGYIESKSTNPLRSDVPKVAQTFLMHRGNIRLEEKYGENGTVLPHSETSIVNDRYFMAIRRKQQPQLLLTSAVRTPNDRFNRVVSRLHGADYLGFPAVIWRGKSHDILHVLPKLKLTSRRETTDGMDTILLEGTSEDVALKLWIAPSLNYSPTKIEWRPTLPKQLTGENIDRVSGHSLYTCEFRQFGRLGDSYVPRNIRVHYVTSGCSVREGRVIPWKVIENTLDVTWTVEIVSPPSTDDFKLSMHIPEQTRVYMEDARDMQYVWHNGAAVRVTDSRQPEHVR